MVKSGALTASREPRPQGHVWKIHLPGHLTASPDAAADPSSDGTLRRQDPSGALEGARAEALATYAATLTAPHLATIERLTGALAAQAHRVGELEQQLLAAREQIKLLEAPPATAEAPRPWYAALLWWRR
jgi:hypothetical protein